METFSIAQHRVLGWSCGGEAMTINIEWQDQFGRWHHYLSKQNQADAYRVAQRRAERTAEEEINAPTKRRYARGTWVSSTRRVCGHKISVSIRYPLHEGGKR